MTFPVIDSTGPSTTNRQFPNQRLCPCIEARPQLIIFYLFNYFGDASPILSRFPRPCLHFLVQ